MSTQDITQAGILGTIAAWAAWDIYAFKKAGQAATESREIANASILFRSVLFAAGVLVGHFFFQMVCICK